MCKKCDNQEGSMCRVCEREMEECKQEPIQHDPWWPSAPVVARRSINVASTSNEHPAELLYV